MSTRIRALTLVDRERDFQDKKWGKDNSHITPDRWMTILGEEFGEVCEAIQRSNVDDIKAELVQVAAVAVRYIEQILQDENI